MRPTIGISLLLLAAACGGGSGTPPDPSVPTASLQGLLVEVDGETADRAGVPVAVMETGAATVTDAEGRFQFAALPAGTATLLVADDSAATPAHASGGDDLFRSDDDDATEDRSGRPVVRLRAGESVEIRLSLRDGEVVEFSRRDGDEIEVRARFAAASSNPFPGSEAHVEVELENDGDRKIEFEVDHVPAGTAIEFFLEDDAAALATLGTAIADATGEAELEFEGALPLGASDLAGLEGRAVEMRLASDGTLLFAGEVPGIPSAIPDSSGPLDASGRARSGTRLVSLVPGAEGEVEMRRRPDQGEVEFEFDVERLDPGTVVLLQIEDPESPGAFVTIATRTTDAGGEADYDTDDGLPLPLGATDVEGFVGLEVRVLAGDGSDELLMFGIISPLVPD